MWAPIASTETPGFDDDSSYYDSKSHSENFYFFVTFGYLPILPLLTKASGRLRSTAPPQLRGSHRTLLLGDPRN